MDLLQSTAVAVPMPVAKYQALGCIVLPDAGAAGVSYDVVNQEGIASAGAGVINVNTPIAGLTQIALAAFDFQEVGTMSVILRDNVGAFISMGQVESGFSNNGLGIGAQLVDSAGNTFGLIVNTFGVGRTVSVTVASTANLGPYSLALIDHANNIIAAINGRIVASLPTAGLDAAGVRAALGMGSANMDTQLGNIIADIATRAAPGAAMTLTAGERNSVASALLDFADAVETGLTPRQAMRLASAILGGQLVQTAPGVWQFKGAGVATARVTASIPGDGSRPSMILNL